MDLDQAENAQIKELINCSESFSYTDDEIESSIFLMIKKMKNNKSSIKSKSDETEVEEEKLVKIKLYHGTKDFHWTGKGNTHAIDMSKTVDEVIAELNSKLDEYTETNKPFEYLKFNGTKLEGDLKKYNLKDDDIVHYWVQSMTK